MKIAIVNNKGGVGKTTTAVNLAAALARRLKKGRVLLVDLDQQANATTALGAEIEEGEKSVADLLVDPMVSAEGVIKETDWDPLDIIPSDFLLGQAVTKMHHMSAREYQLTKKLKKLTSYQHIIVDCPPNLETIALNALTYCDHVIIPARMEKFSIDAVENVYQVIQHVNDQMGELIGHHVEIIGLLPTFFSERNKLTKAAIDELHSLVPVEIMKTSIPSNISLAEAQARQEPIFEYQNRCKGALAYRDLASEVINFEKSRSKKAVCV